MISVLLVERFDLDPDIAAFYEAVVKEIIAETLSSVDTPVIADDVSVSVLRSTAALYPQLEDNHVFAHIKSERLHLSKEDYAACTHFMQMLGLLMFRDYTILLDIDSAVIDSEASLTPIWQLEATSYERSRLDILYRLVFGSLRPRYLNHLDQVTMNQLLERLDETTKRVIDRVMDPINPTL